MSEELEAHVRRLEDLAEIHQLFVDYGAHLDAGDYAAYAELFAVDGEVKLGPIGRAKGRAEIRALMERALDGLAGSSFHIISSPRVTIDGDRANSRVMWSVIQRDTEGRPKLNMVGSHVDELVREDGRWRFRSRSGRIDLPATFGG